MAYDTLNPREEEVKQKADYQRSLDTEEIDEAEKEQLKREQQLLDFNGYEKACGKISRCSFEKGKVAINWDDSEFTPSYQDVNNFEYLC